MLIQVRTDNHIRNSQALMDDVRTEVENAVRRRYAERLQRVEVYLQDVNSHKRGVDTRCAIEAHLAGYQPVAVDATAASVDDAVNAALEMMLRAIEHRLGRLEDRGGRVSMSGQET
jgi:hypothetical protein